MSRIAISLLGPFQATIDGHPATPFRADSARALLAVLAMAPDVAHRRARLAGLLWPEQPDREALRNLRVALSRLRDATGDREADPPFLTITRTTLQLNGEADVWVDVGAFREALATARGHVHTRLERCEACARRLEKAVALCRGELLAGLMVESVPFEEWLVVEREALHREALEALGALGAYHLEGGRYREALEYARRQVALEPWHEAAHRQWMRALALGGQRGAALAQYEACRQVLAEELGVEPEGATRALYEQIREGALAPAAPEADAGRVAAQGQPAGEGLVVGYGQEVEERASLPEPLEERRWVTVLLADVSGSQDPMAAEDVEVWAERMGEVLPLLSAQVYRHGGEVRRYETGGLVAFFGASAAHEDDPERAVLAALAMQEAFGEQTGGGARAGLALRVAVHSGEVIVTPITGDGQVGREAVFGQVLAQAEEMRPVVPAGVVTVSEEVRRQVEPLFAWAPTGATVPRAGGEPAQLYRALARRDVHGKGRGIEGLSSPLVGREEELRALLGAVARLRDGIGGVVTVLGEAGIGKSRLVAEVRARAQVLDTPALAWAEGRCLSYATATAYSLWVDLLRGVLDVAPSASPAAMRSALRMRVEAWCPARVYEVYPFLGRMLSLSLEAEAETSLRGLEPEGLQRLTFLAVERLVEGAARQQPLVLVCEDLHWADPTSLELLEHLLPLTDRVPLLLICVFRPVAEHGCWRIKEIAARDYRHRHTDLWLGPLTEVESVELVSHLLRIEDLPGGLRERILDRAEGNPFYVEEILRSLIDGGIIVHDEATGRWHATRDVTHIPVPDTLRGVLMARIDRLPEVARHVLQLASVVGRIFGRRVLESIAQRAHELGDDLVALQRAQMIRQRARTPEAEYVFKHQLTLEATYDSLLRRKRHELHRRVAQALERLYPERVEEQLGLLAYHWEEAGETARAVHYLQRVGDRAAATYANEEAVDYYVHALDLISATDLVERYDLVLSREKVYDLCAMREAQSEDLVTLEELAEALDDDQRRTEVALRRARYYNRTSAYGESIAAAQQTVDLGRTAQIVAYEAAGYREWARALSYELRHEEARSQAERALDLARRAGLQQIEVDSLHTLGVCHQDMGQLTEAEACFAKELRLCRQMGGRWSEGEALRDLGYVALRKGDVTVSRTYLKRSLHTCRETGNRRDEGWALLGLGQLCMGCGDLAEAKAHLVQALHINRETRDVIGECQSLSGLGDLYLFFWGDDARACSYYEQLQDSAPQIGSRMFVAASLLHLGDVSLQRGKYDKAVDDYEKALRVSRDFGNVLIESLALLELGSVAGVFGDHDLARRRVDEALRLFRAAGWRYAEGLALAYLAIFSHRLGEDEVAHAHSQQALQVIDGPLDLAVWQFPVLRLLMDVALVGVGLFQTELGQFAQASGLYDRALRGMCVLQPHVAAEPLVGLARIALAQSDTVGAMSYVEESLPRLDSCPTPLGMIDSFAVHLTCYHVLNAVDDPRAGEILDRAYHLLQERAGRIEDLALRRSFLENVPAHREISATFHTISAFSRSSPSRRCDGDAAELGCQ